MIGRTAEMSVATWYKHPMNMQDARWTGGLVAQASWPGTHAPVAPVSTVAAQAPGSQGAALLMMPQGPGRDALAAALTHVGFQLLAFDSPLEVAGHLFGLRPRVVLVDATHGAFMGTQAAAWLRLAGLQSPVVVMGNTAPDFAEHMHRAGVAHVVAYPTDLQVFAHQVVDAALQASPPPSLGGGMPAPVMFR